MYIFYYRFTFLWICILIRKYIYVCVCVRMCVNAFVWMCVCESGWEHTCISERLSSIYTQELYKPEINGYRTHIESNRICVSRKKNFSRSSRMHFRWRIRNERENHLPVITSLLQTHQNLGSPFNVWRLTRYGFSKRGEMTEKLILLQKRGERQNCLVQLNNIEKGWQDYGL